MEDFVSFEIAKKLKEKGFNIPSYFYYRTDDKFLHNAVVGKPLVYCDKIDDDVVIAPTISQVSKWLRNNKKTMISILPVAFNEKENKFNQYYCTIYYATKEFVFESHERPDTFETYEECALDAIEYSLDNLI